VVIGFDLDMTLVDSRPGIAATYRELSRLTGVPIDADAAVGRLGPPLEHEIARWYPPEQRSAAVDRYRSLYPHHAILPSAALPGAAEAIAAVHARGGRVLVVTA
jgi:phosphoglycolate phosphatase